MTTELAFADEASTIDFGRKLAAALRPGDVVALSGDLGAGKTTLARAVLKALGLEEEAPSPTFAIVQPYEPPETSFPVWHVDLFRIEQADEVQELGLSEARRDAALIIEWPERMGSALWPDALRFKITLAPEEGGQPAARRLTAEVPSAWETRWPLR